ncbi:MAG: hypothetical protein P8Q14_04070 [Vicingaceae bacterium]|nr:hypothetical protein [Vicingaceae bacterium]
MTNLFFSNKSTGLLIVVLMLFIYGCGAHKIEEINIGFIAPLSTRATDLGIDPSKAMELAIEQYNLKRKEGQPKVNLFLEDDEWDKDNALS